MSGEGLNHYVHGRVDLDNQEGKIITYIRELIRSRENADKFNFGYLRRG